MLLPLVTAVKSYVVPAIVATGAHLLVFVKYLSPTAAVPSTALKSAANVPALVIVPPVKST